MQLEYHPPGPLGRGERELEAPAISRVALDPLDLREFLDPRLRLFGLARLVAEALDEALHTLDLRSLGVDRLAERDLPCGLLGAPLVPRAGKEARATGLELEDGGPDRLEEPAIVGDEKDGCVELDERLLEPFQGLDVQVIGGLVEEQHVGARGKGTGERRAGELPAGEGVEASLEIPLGESEPARHRRRPIAPQVAAACLKARLRARIPSERRLIGGAAGHPALEALEL